MPQVVRDLLLVVRGDVQQVADRGQWQRKREVPQSSARPCGSIASTSRWATAVTWSRSARTALIVKCFLNVPRIRR